MPVSRALLGRGESEEHPAAGAAGGAAVHRAAGCPGHADSAALHALGAEPQGARQPVVGELHLHGGLLGGTLARSPEDSRA